MCAFGAVSLIRAISQLSFISPSSSLKKPERVPPFRLKPCYFPSQFLQDRIFARASNRFHIASFQACLKVVQ
jgi:hypothetical protein